ncbi:MAG TPA: two-component regulator propeller domain-containing protein [Thermoanaerobaculia bacterium]|nr:two-component regulator propeller domain-containing protein [Thermoanaerobaculia bacterium]
MVQRPVVLLLALCLASGAFALDPNRALTQARLSVWTNESGLPQTTINALVQTSDGYLWMGTEEGLVRFDGMRFIVSDHQSAPALRTPFISGLYEAPDKTLWIGTYGGGVARLRNGQIESLHPEILGSDRIREFHTARNGAVYVATAGGGVLRIDGDNVTRFTTKDGLPSDRIWSIVDDGDGGWWVATHGGGVVQWRDGVVKQRITMQEGLPNDIARTLLLDPDGTLWIGTDGGGLVAWRNGAIVRRITTRDGLPNDFVRTLRRDRHGSLWIGTDGGLARFRGTHVEAMGVAEGLPNAGIRSILEDREGSLWIGTTAGLVRLCDTRVLPYTRREGLPVDTIRALLEDSKGRIWAGTEGGGLCQVTPGPVQCKTKADGLPHDAVYALIESRDGSLWIGTDGGGVVRYRDGKFVDRIKGLPNDRIRALAETPGGDLWISTSAGLAFVHNGRATIIKEFEDRQLRPLLLLPDGTLLVGTDGAGLWRLHGYESTLVATYGKGLESDRIFSLTMDADGGGVWIGTSGGGLARLDLATNSVQSLIRHDGLYDDVVFHVVDAGPGKDLWLTSNRGVYRVNRNRVLEAMGGKKSYLRGAVYGTIDGMPSAEGNGAFHSAIVAHDGRVWVATSRGIAVIDPGANMQNDVPPPVHVEEVLIDGVRARDGVLRIAPDTQRLELRYTALSLRVPERVTFRYMLEGYDRGWVDAGSNRVATYTELAPGTYTFRVVAKNEDGVQSNVEARLALTVIPRWFETWWARLTALALLAAILWIILRIRLATLHRRHAELEAIVAERTSSLRAETERAEAASRAKSDFLANMSHELRTPLNAVLGFVQLMERRPGRDGIDREHLTIISRSGEHLLGLINEVLSLSKIEAGHAKRTDAPFDLGRLMRGLGELFQARARSKGLTLFVEVDESANVIVSGDEGKLRQITLNLLGNAMKFTSRGSVVLRAKWAEDRARVEVEDTGSGIDENELKDVFEAFAQTESGLRANEGSGLGLAISRGLARIHGGDVTIESRVGEGTLVRVELALPLASDAVVPERVRSAGRVVTLAADQAPPHVMVVDDSPDNRQLIAELLQSAGVDVTEAGNGEDAIARLQKEPFDLIFMDLRMQGISGFEATRRIRAGVGQALSLSRQTRQAESLTRQAESLSYTPRIVVLSASAFDHERAEAFECGADAFLTKPFRDEAVFAQLENLLGTRFMREEPSRADVAVAGPLSLAGLPADLRIRLKAAAAGGETEALNALADEAALHDPAIGAQLAALARSYRFDEIEAALKETTS